MERRMNTMEQKVSWDKIYKEMLATLFEKDTKFEVMKWSQEPPKINRIELITIIGGIEIVF